MSFLGEFKAFAMRGNVVDLAVAVIMGSAFGKIVTALVSGIVIPLIGLLLGGVDVSAKALIIGQATVKWGLFLQAIIDFTIISFAIFLAVKAINSLHITVTKDPTAPSTEEKLLMEIRDLLKERNDTAKKVYHDFN